MFPPPSQRRTSRNVVAVEVDPGVAFAIQLRQSRLRSRLTQKEAARRLGLRSRLQLPAQKETRKPFAAHDQEGHHSLPGLVARLGARESLTGESTRGHGPRSSSSQNPLTYMHRRGIFMHMRTTLNVDANLLREAGKLTGVSEKTTLVRLGLKALIAREKRQAAGRAWRDPRIAWARFLEDGRSREHDTRRYLRVGRPLSQR